jgi:hypothetical protein
MALLWLLIVVIVEAMSFVPDPSPCLVDIEGYVSVYSQQGAKGCAPLHIIAIGSVGALRGLITQNHDVITAISTAVIALVAFMLWSSTRRLWESSKTVAEDMARSRRAYVKMSHLAPGIQPEGTSGLFGIRLGIKNFGQTPATITDILLNCLVLPKGVPLPESPLYERQSGSIPTGFLVANDEMVFHRHYQITSDDMTAVRDHQSDLYLIGYVDYMDQFGQRHRAGYARLYRAMTDDRKSYRHDAEFEERNNLNFVVKDGYNYDHPRAAGA